MSFLKNNRSFWSLMFISSIFLISMAYYFQHVVGLNPCFLCIIQRMAVMAIGIGSLVMLISPTKIYTRIIGNFVFIVGALIGLSAAVRQMYIQRFPDPMASCGPGYEYILENSSLVQALPKLLSATGSCTDIDWTFLGFSMAECMIPIFIAYLVLNLIVNFKKAV